MKKVFYYVFLSSTVITGVVGIYVFVVKQDLGMTSAAFFECIFSGILTIMLEPRPRTTVLQRQHDDRVKSQGLGLLILTSAALVLVVFLASCKTSGYGCKGRESWNHMEKRINRGY